MERLLLNVLFWVGKSISYSLLEPNESVSAGEVNTGLSLCHCFKSNPAVRGVSMTQFTGMGSPKGQIDYGFQDSREMEYLYSSLVAPLKKSASRWVLIRSSPRDSTRRIEPRLRVSISAKRHGLSKVWKRYEMTHVAVSRA